MSETGPSNRRRSEPVLALVIALRGEKCDEILCITPIPSEAKVHFFNIQYDCMQPPVRFGLPLFRHMGEFDEEVAVRPTTRERWVLCKSGHAKGFDVFFRFLAGGPH